MKATDIPEIEKLSKPEKILLVEDLWDEIASDDSDIPVPDSHKKELDISLKKHKNNQGELLILEEHHMKIEMKN